MAKLVLLLVIEISLSAELHVLLYLVISLHIHSLLQYARAFLVYSFGQIELLGMIYYGGFKLIKICIFLLLLNFSKHDLFLI